MHEKTSTILGWGKQHMGDTLLLRTLIFTLYNNTQLSIFLMLNHISNLLLTVKVINLNQVDSYNANVFFSIVGSSQLLPWQLY